MTILYFGPARDCAGIQSERLDHGEPLALDDLWRLLIERHPRLAGCRGISRVAVDMEYLDDDGIVPAGAEVAIIPPVAGG